MKELKCKNCGAPLTRDGKCEYCGARYQIEPAFGETIHVMEILPPQAQTIGAEVVQDKYERRLLPAERSAEMAVGMLKAKLVDALAEYLRLDVHEDLMSRATIVRGTIRVIPPDYRY